MGIEPVIHAEADFSIHGVLSYNIGGHELWITTTTIGMVIVSIIILILAFMAKKTMEKASDVHTPTAKISQSQGVLSAPPTPSG